MAQTRETAANTAAQSLFTKNDPTDIKNEPELSAISKKFIYHDINKQIKLSTAKQELLTLVVLTANNTPRIFLPTSKALSEQVQRRSRYTKAFSIARHTLVCQR